MSITDTAGEVISWSSAGASGFKGARKGTPFAAQTAAEAAARRALDQGMRQIEVLVRGPGSGRETAIRVLIYLRGTLDRDLVFRPNKRMPFEVFVDSSWEAKFSCSGAMLFIRGCLFMWFVKTQRSVSLSSAEAEYFGAMLAAKELIFTREILVDLGFALDGPTSIRTDSKSAVDMAYDPVAFKKTKHILRAAEFLRDLVARDAVSLQHVAGAVMIADLLTKAQARSVFLELLIIQR